MPHSRFIYGNKDLFAQSLPSFDNGIPSDFASLLEKLRKVNDELNGTSLLERRAVWHLISGIIQNKDKNKAVGKLKELKSACSDLNLVRVLAVLDKIEGDFT